MDSRLRPPLFTAPLPPLLPAWVVPRSASANDLDALMTGIALTSRDNLVRTKPAWVGAWRQCIALNSAVTAIRLPHRNENKTAIRDAFCSQRRATIRGRLETCFWPTG
ncbi:DUF1403 family protein [Pararhizobium sp. A13]|uniref:DUF1403 family protein n=1 Tax=Pararhizobium sp. A13 TaxID=3133975 RepID=UPI00311B0783